MQPISKYSKNNNKIFNYNVVIFMQPVPKLYQSKIKMSIVQIKFY